MAALPYLIMIIVVQSGGRFADFLRSSGAMSTTHVRKLFNTLGRCYNLFERHIVDYKYFSLDGL